MRRTPTKRTIQVAPGRTIEVDGALLAPISEPVPADLGLYEISLDPDDRWKYRTPSLRNVALTAPYMHDGSLRSLSEVVAFYDRGGDPNPLLDPRIRPLDLSAQERADLVAFLAALTGGDVETLIADAFAAPIGDPH
jgi:cytochrome c peroxidase